MLEVELRKHSPVNYVHSTATNQLSLLNEAEKYVQSCVFLIVFNVFEDLVFILLLFIRDLTLSLP